MQIDARTAFWAGLIITFCTGVSTGAVHLAHAIPDAWIPAVTAWTGIAALFGSAFQTMAAGLSSNKPGPLVGNGGAPK